MACELLSQSHMLEVQRERAHLTSWLKTRKGMSDDEAKKAARENLVEFRPAFVGGQHRRRVESPEETARPRSSIEALGR